MSELNNKKNDWIKPSLILNKIERLEAFFSGYGYSSHRHDTYAIGQTLSGVQSFQYRKTRRNSLAGNIMVLHPDELHDGEAGTHLGFHYRMVYIEPTIIQNILQGKPLPFLQGGISNDIRLRSALFPLLNEEQQDPLQIEDALYDLTLALNAVSTKNFYKKQYVDYFSTEMARIYIHDNIDKIIRLDELANISGTDKWQLSRDFRILFGTSPYRYLIMRRLEISKKLMLSGNSIANAALTAGFFDQSHMSKKFIETYGIPPKAWLRKIKC